ncbi:MAG: YlmH/Sll1252 family protein [Eubacteriaceae bacterium]
MTNKYSNMDISIKNINYQAECLDGLVFFDFYDPSQQRIISRELNKMNDIIYLFNGGNDLSERKMLCIYQKDHSKKFDWPISIVSININYEITHRVVLGSILNLGITRETIGDIIIADNEVQIIAKTHIAKYIYSNLYDFNKRPFKMELKPIKEIKRREQKYLIDKVIVTSFRIDAIISSAYGISRALSTDMIKKGGVKVNYEYIYKTSISVQIKDMISVKGKGRFIIDELLGSTKKGRKKIQIKKYL